MTSITTQTVSRRDFLRAAGLGLAGLGTAASTTKADGDGRLQDTIDLNEKAYQERMRAREYRRFLPAATLGGIGLTFLILSQALRSKATDAQKSTSEYQI